MIRNTWNDRYENQPARAARDRNRMLATKRLVKRPTLPKSFVPSAELVDALLAQIAA